MGGPSFRHSNIEHYLLVKDDMLELCSFTIAYSYKA